MEIGIFAKTFVRSTLTETLDAVVAHDIHYVQFNMQCAGLPSMPDSIEPETLETIQREMATRQITMAALSGTFNMIAPNVQQRQQGMQRLRTLMASCQTLQTQIITLSTGTRHPTQMWQWHPDNSTPEAWHDLVQVMAQAVEMAESYHVTLAFEPEVSNVIDSAQKARRLLDEIRSPYLKVVLDGANLFHAGELARMQPILEEACALLAPDVALVHAKDLLQDGEAGHIAAGRGLLDYPFYLRLLQRLGYTGPLIMHSLSEEEVTESVAFLRSQLASLTS